MRRRLFKYILFTAGGACIILLAAVLTLALTGTEFKALANGKTVKQDSVESQVYVEAYNQHNLIRFHVIANSDSDRDQALKRRVRDLIVERMTPEFSKVKTFGEAKVIADSHLADMKKIAQDEVSVWGERYPVQVQLGKFDFPIKTYGNLTLPAGNYEAVRVVIGKGQGANWWCVLFPPLCFVDVSRGMAPLDPPAPKIVKKVGIKPNPKKSYKVKVRFKILEFLKINI